LDAWYCLALPAGQAEHASQLYSASKVQLRMRFTHPCSQFYRFGFTGHIEERE